MTISATANARVLDVLRKLEPAADSVGAFGDGVFMAGRFHDEAPAVFLRDQLQSAEASVGMIDDLLKNTHIRGADREALKAARSDTAKGAEILRPVLDAFDGDAVHVSAGDARAMFSGAVDGLIQLRTSSLLGPARQDPLDLPATRTGIAKAMKELEHLGDRGSVDITEGGLWNRLERMKHAVATEHNALRDLRSGDAQLRSDPRASLILRELHNAWDQGGDLERMPHAFSVPIDTTDARISLRTAAAALDSGVPH